MIEIVRIYYAIENDTANHCNNIELTRNLLIIIQQ